jgi:acyl-CoA thioesterase
MNIENIINFFKNDRFAALAGIEIVEASTGYCKARMVIEDKHLNSANVVQGGAIFTLADFAFGLASNSHGQLALAINVSITFLKGKPSGILYATAREVADPKRIGAYTVDVTDENGEMVACFNGLVYRKNEMIK